MGLMLAAGCLGAESPEGPRLGVQLGLVYPQGDLGSAVDRKEGLSVGIHGTLPLGRGLVLCPRGDYTRFPTWKESYSATTEQFSYRSDFSREISSLSLGADLRLHSSRVPGLYALVGLATIAWKQKTSGSLMLRMPGQESSGQSSEATTWRKAGYSIGTGFLFGPHGFLEARYTWSRFREEAGSARTFVLATGYRF